MEILVVGSGGREHAICWKLAQSPKVSKIFCAPGNAGIAQLAECINIKANDIDGLLRFAKEQGIDLTIVGPEDSLCLGIVDAFEREGLKIFGPNKAAAILEGSKLFMKELLKANGIPTADFIKFANTFEVRTYLANTTEENFPLVLKLDGLAAGKGVCVCSNAEEAEAFLKEIDGGKFEGANKTIILEDFLDGEEASYIVVVAKDSFSCSLATSQDHKRLNDGDLGPNTGGMGAYSPAPVITPEVEEKILEWIIFPTIVAMQEAGRPFSGFLYAGIVVKDGEPYVLEFNVRLGDPEAQPILMRMKSDLVELILAALDSTLDEYEIEWHDDPAVCVVMATEDYPKSQIIDDEISGIEEAEKTGAVVFHAGTARNTEGGFVTYKGRVLGVTARGKDIQTAKDNAYLAIEKIHFRGMHYRKDIADKAIGR